MALRGWQWHGWMLIFIYLSHLIIPSFEAASDSELLLNFKKKLQNYNNQLSSWDPSVPPCSYSTSNWRGILCYQGKVWGLKLEKMSLKGFVDIDSLKRLPYLRILNFMNNDFEGPWPEFQQIIGLKAIYLSNNKFSGEIPHNTFQGLKWLKKVHLSNNRFTGSIPTSLTLLPRLIELKLNGNQFTGLIPHFPTPNKLRSFNVANNHLSGEIPASVSMMPISSFAGNERLCGAPLEACTSKPSTLSIIIALIVVCVAFIMITPVIIFILRRRRRRNQSETSSLASLESPVVFPSSIMKGQVGNDSIKSSRSVGSTHSRRGDHVKLSFLRDDRVKFDLQALLKASAEILGSGCFSSSYKADINNGPTIVVKRYKQMNNVGRHEFQEHMRRIGRLNHPNLLPSVAYYYKKEEKLLVTDYIHNGSLAIRLHGNHAIGESTLHWPTRLKIVKGIAKGLEYLYKDMPNLIAPHGNLKSSNVLLTESFDPLLTDYGLVPVINQDMAQDTMVIYKSPEYLQQGRITKKTDVWCLGILIIEILTGKFPANFLQQGKGSEVSLASWVHSVVPEEWTNAVFDQDMGKTDNCEGEMRKLLKIAMNCCEGDVDKRWDLKEAVEKIQEVNERDQQDLLTS